MTFRINRRNTLKIIAGGGTAIALARPAIVSAQDAYPSRPISLVNPNPPAGYTDHLARVLSGPLTKEFGKPVSVVNIPGASEMLGHQYVLDQPADGYYLLCTAASFI